MQCEQQGVNGGKRVCVCVCVCVKELLHCPFSSLDGVTISLVKKNKRFFDGSLLFKNHFILFLSWLFDEKSSYG